MKLCHGFDDTLSMRQIKIFLAFLSAALAAVVAHADTAPAHPAPAKEPVWEASLSTFDEQDYGRAVEALFQNYERTTGRKLAPGPKKRVGLKIYTDSGPGLETPWPLTKAVIAALERRGFANENIFLVGLNQMRLRMTGYLPTLSTGQTQFRGNPVYVLESGRYYDPVWFYDSPLPSRFDPIVAQAQTKDVPNESTLEQDRKSFLATPLFLNADFWINLPVYTDHPVLGVNGSLVNATLWNASNTARFFRSTANAPAAVAEMSAIPELRQTWVFTITSLQIYQFIGGPWFDSLYTNSEPRLWLSTDPVLLDSLMLKRINKARRLNGFEPVSEDIHTLDDAAQLGVGSENTAEAQIIHVPTEGLNN
jgi:hypothetical protein